MQVRAIANFTAMSLFTLAVADADPVGVEATPAWQTPGFVMEEVVVTAPVQADPAAARLARPRLRHGRGRRDRSRRGPHAGLAHGPAASSEGAAIVRG